MCLSVWKHASAEYVTNTFSSKKNYEKLAVVVHVLQTTHNLVISRCCFAEDGKEMYQELKRICIAIVLLIKAFVCWRPRCRCRRVLLKVPNRSLSNDDDDAEDDAQVKKWIYILQAKFAIV